MKTKQGKFVFWHVIGCVTFLALPAVLSPHPPEEVDFLFSPPSIRDFIANGLMLLVFYLNYYWLVDKLYFQKRYFLYVGCIGLAFITILILPSLLTGYIPWNRGAMDIPMRLSETVEITMLNKVPNQGFLLVVYHHIFLFISVILFSVLLKIRDRLMKTDKAKHNAEINYLKSQINPHFLFNILNSIYATAIKDKSKSTAENILRLSGLMRYAITESDSGLVSLDKELKYIRDYVSLQKMRLDDQVKFDFKITGDPHDLQIAPLLLFPFIENAFKHGINPDENSWINILIKVEQMSVNLVVKNKKVKVAINELGQSGIGIDNTSARLQLLYPGKHILAIKQENGIFDVKLKLELK